MCASAKNEHIKTETECSEYKTHEKKQQTTTTNDLNVTMGSGHTQWVYLYLLISSPHQHISKLTIRYFYERRATKKKCCRRLKYTYFNINILNAILFRKKNKIQNYHSQKTTTTTTAMAMKRKSNKYTVHRKAAIPANVYCA